MARYECLLVDDEEALSQSTCEYFNLLGVSTYWAADEAACLEFTAHHQADMILLDINLGHSSGFALCKRLRETLDVPIVFISARTSDEDVLLALNIGGDDYIPKPYSLSILLAKVKAVLKRCRSVPALQSFGRFTLDTSMERLLDGRREIKLKAMEYKLLHYFLQNRNRILSKEELFAKVWNEGITSDGTLNVHIHRLREKIGDNPNEPHYIRTVWGTGYVFSDDKVEP